MGYVVKSCLGGRRKKGRKEGCRRWKRKEKQNGGETKEGREEAGMEGKLQSIDNEAVVKEDNSGLISSEDLPQGSNTEHCRTRRRRWTGQKAAQSGEYSEQRFKVKAEKGLAQCCHIPAREFKVRGFSHGAHVGQGHGKKNNE